MSPALGARAVLPRVARSPENPLPGILGTRPGWAVPFWLAFYNSTHFQCSASHTAGENCEPHQILAGILAGIASTILDTSCRFEAGPRSGCRYLGAGRPTQPGRFPSAHFDCTPTSDHVGTARSRPPHAPATPPGTAYKATGRGAMRQRRRKRHRSSLSCSAKDIVLRAAAVTSATARSGPIGYR